MTLNKRNALALLAAKAVLGATLALGFATTPHAVAQPAAVCMEDQPCWSCVDDGNRICGPDNTEGKPAGCYDDGGVLVATWPCTAWTPADPDEQVYAIGYTN